MTTITMTFRQLVDICYHRGGTFDAKTHPFRWCHATTGVVKCEQSNCPIWRRAEKREIRNTDWSGVSHKQQHTDMVFGPPPPTVVDGKLKPGKKVKT